MRANIACLSGSVVAVAGRAARFGLIFTVLAGLVVALAAPAAAGDPWKDARKAFRKGLRAEDWQSRHAAYERFRQYDGAATVEEMLSKLAKEKSAAVVLRVLPLLASFQSPDAQEALVKALRKKRGTRRVHALLAIRDQAGPAGKDELLKILRGQNAQHAAQAALALGRKGIGEAIPLLIEDLAHKDWQRRAAAARAIHDIADLAAHEAYTERVPPGVGVAQRVIQTARVKSQDVAAETAGAALVPLVDALEGGVGSERRDIIRTLDRITGRDYGWDVAAWRQLASGAPPDTIVSQRKYPPHAVGIPLFGRRVVIIVCTGTNNENPLPFKDRSRLESICKVPGARDVPWIRLRTKRQFICAHAARIARDLPVGSQFEVIGPTLNLHELFGRLTSVNPGTRDQAVTFIEELKLENGVDHHSALHRALDVSGRKESVAYLKGPDEIVVFAGNSPWRADVTDMDEIGAEIALKARMRMVPIHTIGVGSHPFPMLVPISEQSGGTYVNLAK